MLRIENYLYTFLFNKKKVDKNITLQKHAKNILRLCDANKILFAFFWDNQIKNIVVKTF